MSHLSKLSLILIIVLAWAVLAATDNSPREVTNDNRLDESDILAEYDGGKILRKDLETKISKLPQNYQGRYRTVEGQTEVLNIMAVEEAFYQKALKMGLDKDPTVLSRLADVDKRFYIQEYYNRNVSELVVVTDADLQDFYNQNLSTFYLNPYITIDYLQAEDEATAKKALAELKRGKSFGEVSEKYNINAYAKSLKGRIKSIRLNGNIPGIGNDPDLENMIKSSRADTLTYVGPAQTSTGWHIFRTVEMIPGRQKEFAEVKPEIEQRMRPTKERETLDALILKLKEKYSVVTDTSLVARIDLKTRANNDAILNSNVVTSPHPELNVSVKQILDSYDKIPPQEQIFITKGGGITLLVDQEVIQNLLYMEGKAHGYEQYFKDNEDYLATRRMYVLRKAFEELVVSSIEVTPEEISARYNADLEQYAVPAHRSIEVLFFTDKKVANKAWKKYNAAYKKKNNAKMQEVIKKYSSNPDGALLQNQYQNGVVTGIGPDQEFSNMIWNNPVGYLSPVFTNARGDIVFFRTLDETAKTYRPQVEAEPRIYGTIKKEKEKARQDAVTEQLFVEFNMRKYPERVKLLMTAEELFDQADSAARQRNFKDAIVFYDQIINNFPNFTDDYKASFMKAFLVAEEMKNTDLALQLFKDFLIKYPSGDLNESARFMIDSLEGKIPAEIEAIEQN